MQWPCRNNIVWECTHMSKCDNYGVCKTSWGLMYLNHIQYKLLNVLRTTNIHASTADVIPVYSVPLTDEWYVDKADGQHCSRCLLPDLSSHAPITSAGTCSPRLLPQIHSSPSNDHPLLELEREKVSSNISVQLSYKLLLQCRTAYSIL